MGDAEGGGGDVLLMYFMSTFLALLKRERAPVVVWGMVLLVGGRMGAGARRGGGRRDMVRWRWWVVSVGWSWRLCGYKKRGVGVKNIRRRRRGCRCEEYKKERR